MELRHYFWIVRRSWPLVVGLPALVGLITLALAFLLPPSYVITAAMLVTQRPLGVVTPQINLPDYNNFHSWAASEYIDDDILQVVETRRFAEDIAGWLQTQHGLTLDPDRISRGIEAERKHRMIYLTVTAAAPTHARLIAQGAITMLQQNGLRYWQRDETTTLHVSELDLPAKAAREPGLLGMAFDVVLRGMLALMLAIGIAFLRHYLDQSIQRVGEIEALGMEVVGAIPLDGVARLRRRG